jgi:hypothetical protein
VRELAATPAALGVAALLVLSAALARNYDQRLLLVQPWRLLGPFVASLATSGVLFGFVYGVATLAHIATPGIGRPYRSFLTLYWATAPLAWLYGIPFERLLNPFNATRANLIVLGIVSAWRVALMIRVVSVLFGMRVIAAFPIVMLVADAIAWAALVFSPVPIIHVMGATDPRAQLVSDVSLYVLTLSTIIFPVWLVLAVWAGVTWRPSWSVTEPDRPLRAGRAMGFAGLAVAAWAALAILAQTTMPPAPRQAAPASPESGLSRSFDGDDANPSRNKRESRQNGDSWVSWPPWIIKIAGEPESVPVSLDEFGTPQSGVPVRPEPDEALAP